jgi:hypothetical protein
MMAMFIYPLLDFLARTVDRVEGTELSKRRYPLSASLKRKGKYLFSSFMTHWCCLWANIILSLYFILRSSHLTHFTLRSFRTFGKPQPFVKGQAKNITHIATPFFFVFELLESKSTKRKSRAVLLAFTLI